MEEEIPNFWRNGMSSSLDLTEALRSHFTATSRKDVRYYQAGSSEMFGSTPPHSELTPFHPRENELDLLQHYRQDRRVLLNFIISGNLIKKVIMPPGSVSLDDIDLDQVSVDYVINCARKGDMLELSAIRDYHDNSQFLHMNSCASTREFFLATNPEISGSPPRQPPPAVPIILAFPIIHNLSKSEDVDEESLSYSERQHEKSSSILKSLLNRSLSKEESFNSNQARELTVDDIEDFEDDDNLDEIESRRISRRIPNDASDIAPGLPPFKHG